VQNINFISRETNTMKSPGLHYARGQIILCKVLLSGFIIEISLAYKISFIRSLILNVKEDEAEFLCM